MLIEHWEKFDIILNPYFNLISFCLPIISILLAAFHGCAKSHFDETTREINTTIFCNQSFELCQLKINQDAISSKGEF